VRQKIDDAAKRFEAVPVLAARRLNQGSTRVIGMFASPATHVSEGLYEPLIESILEVLHACDHHVFFDPSARRSNRIPF
jgi:DNA-binding LacI/PurR family transcriptional regulator